MKTYNAKEISVLVNNVAVTGLGESMVTCSKDEEFFSSSVGAQGDVVKSEINNSLGTITLTTTVACPQQKMLIDLAKSRTTFPVWINSSSEVAGGTTASIKNYPEIEYGAEAPEMEFEIQVFDFDVKSK